MVAWFPSKNEFVPKKHFPPKNPFGFQIIPIFAGLIVQSESGEMP